MAGKTVELAVRMSSDVAGVAGDFDSVGAAALRMSGDVDRATSQADASAGRLTGVADASDVVASNSAQAAGGLGDLGAALAGLPGPLGAVGAGMEAAAVPVMGLVGAGDLLNLATKANIVSTVKQKVVTVASTVATKAATVAQKALNLAMRANPIGIIITAVIVLVGLFITLYKRSETFRNIIGVLKDKVGDAFGAMLRPIQFVIDKVMKVIGWFQDAIAATKRALGLGKEYGSTMGRILGAVMDDLASIGQQIRDNYAAGGQGGPSGGGVGNPRLLGGTTIDATTIVHVDASNLYEQATLERTLTDLLRRNAVRIGQAVPGAKVVYS